MDDINYAMKVVLKNLIKAEQHNLNTETEELKKLPKGNLVIKRRGDKLFFYKRERKKDIGITKNPQLVYKLARKTYLSNLIKIRRNNIKQLNNCLNNIPTFTYTPSTKYPSPILSKALYSEKECIWLDSADSRNTYKSKNLIYKTKSGILVRSKSERLIADRLSHYGIVFKYEPKMIINGNAIFPDFVILKKDESIIIWEHNGMMDNSDYAFKAYQKIRNYNNAGFFQNRNLICTEEQDILDTKTIDEIIFRYILT